MQLIFLRHGQAEKKSDSGKDEDRLLTRAGQRGMRASLNRAFTLLPNRGQIAVMTSPLIRARQTAEIALQAIQKIWGKDRLLIKEPIISDNLKEPEIDGLLDEIVSFQREKKTALTEQKTEENVSLSLENVPALIIVGHDPQLSDIASHLTGLKINMKKGAAVCLELPDLSGEKEEALVEGTAGAAKVLWFVQGPDFKHWKTLTDIEDILSRGFQRVVDNCTFFRTHPEDVDAVHDLRISIRTLRSLVTFFQPFQKKKQNERMQRNLRAIVIQLSRLREYDVLIEESGRVDIDLNPVGDHPAPPIKLDDELKALREKEAEKVCGSFSRRRFDNRLQMLKEDFADFQWKNRIEKEGLEVPELEKRLEEMADAFFTAYDKLDFNDAEASHKVRKRAKKIRYAANKLKSVIGRHSEIITRMKKMQDQLGKLCDARVNQELLTDLINSCGLSEIARWQAENLITLAAEDEKQIIASLISNQGESAVKIEK